MYYSDLEELWSRCRNKTAGKPFYNQFVRFRKEDDGNFYIFNKTWQKTYEEHPIATVDKNDITTFTAETNLITERHVLNKIFDIKISKQEKEVQHLIDVNFIVSNTGILGGPKYKYKPGMQLAPDNTICYVPPYQKRVPDREYNNLYTQQSKKFRKKLKALHSLLPDKFKVNINFTPQSKKVFIGEHNKWGTKRRLLPITPLSANEIKQMLWRLMANNELLTKEQYVHIKALHAIYNKWSPKKDPYYSGMYDKDAEYVIKNKLDPADIHKLINNLRYEWLEAQGKMHVQSFTQEIKGHTHDNPVELLVSNKL